MIKKSSLNGNFCDFIMLWSVEEVDISEIEIILLIPVSRKPVNNRSSRIHRPLLESRAYQ